MFGLLEKKEKSNLDECCPTLTYKERMIGFCMCSGFGI